MSNSGILSTPSGNGAYIKVNENNVIECSNNLQYAGGGAIGFNPEYPNELVISADGFTIDGSCISIKQQTNKNIGDILIFARNTELNNTAQLILKANGEFGQYAPGYYQEISTLGYPAALKSSFELSATGASYIAPYNGWIYVAASASAEGQGIELSSFNLAASCFASVAKNYLRVFIPVVKNQTFTFKYSTPDIAYFECQANYGDILKHQYTLN